VVCTGTRKEGNETNSLSGRRINTRPLRHLKINAKMVFRVIRVFLLLFYCKNILIIAWLSKYKSKELNVK